MLAIASHTWFFGDGVADGLGEGHGFQERAEDVRHVNAQAVADGADPVARLDQIGGRWTEGQRGPDGALEHKARRMMSKRENIESGGRRNIRESFVLSALTGSGCRAEGDVFLE